MSASSLAGRSWTAGIMLILAGAYPLTCAIHAWIDGDRRSRSPCWSWPAASPSRSPRRSELFRPVNDGTSD